MSNNYNSDGYVMIDLSDVDVTKSTQNVPGIYSRILNVIDANKLILIVNHQGLTPQAAICNKLLNYYVITTNLYIYKINSNDIVIIEQAGSSSVEVSIIPTLMSGTKIADFAIGSVEGSLYAPEFETEINDNVTASNSTWSSEKIDAELDLKADAADLATVATSGNYTDLTNKPTIPTKTSDLTNDSGYITDADVPTIDDTTTSTTKVWSSEKIDAELDLKADAADLATVATSGSYNDLSNKPTIPTKTSDLTNDSGYITDADVPTIDDTTTANNKVWSSLKTSNELSNKADVLMLGGFKIQYRNIESNSTVNSPFFNEMCIAFCSRGANALGVASTASANALVNDSNVTFGLNTQDGYRMSVASNVGTHIKVCFIYY